MAAFLALSAAACWGTADFVGGLQARRVSPLTVARISQVTGAGLLAGAVALEGTPPPSWGLTFVGLGTGVVAAAAFWGLYAALAMGTMARVAPVFATASAIPVIVGIADGDRLSSAQVIGMVAASAGVLFVSMESSRAQGETARLNKRRAIWVALLTSCALGVTMVGVDRVATESALWATFIPRATGAVLLSSIALVAARNVRRLEHASLAPLIGIGSLDTAANLLWAIASSAGKLSLVAVLGAVFPAVTVVLSVVILRERLESIQILGIVVTLAGGALITAG